MLCSRVENALGLVCPWFVLRFEPARKLASMAVKCLSSLTRLESQNCAAPTPTMRQIVPVFRARHVTLLWTTGD